MKLKQAGVYYSPKFGYIITPYAKRKDIPLRYIIEPVITLKSQVSLEILSNKIVEVLNITKNAADLDPSEAKDADFWSSSGIKRFSNFSKEYRCINISEANNCFQIREWKRHKSGEYVGQKNDEIVRIPIDSSPEQIGQAVLKLLSIEIAIEDDTKQTFETLHGSIVHYARPSDDFLDLGDGGTDAYQIYEYEGNTKSSENYIAFLLALYSELKEEVVKKRWSQMYGELLEFEYKKVNDNSLMITITGKTVDRIIISNIYRDNDLYFEVMAEIDFSNTLAAVQKRIESEYNKVIDSIKIVKK